MGSMVHNFFDKKTGSGGKANVNEVLAQELYKPVTKVLKIREVNVMFKDNILMPDWAEMGSLSSKNWGIKYLLCVIDLFTKSAWIKDNKAKSVLVVLLKS